MTGVHRCSKTLVAKCVEGNVKSSSSLPTASASSNYFLLLLLNMQKFS